AVHIAELGGEPDGPAAAEVRDAAGPRDGISLRVPALRRLDALGLLRPGFTAIGAGACDASELELLSLRGACLVACPQADLRLGAGWGPITALDSDRTGLGTDSPAAAGAFDLLAETRTAALLAGLPAREALRTATLGGATALGLGAHIGSIEPGKAADLLCIDLEAECEGAARPEDTIVFAATRAQVSDVWTAGRSAVRAGRLLAFEESELLAVTQRWAQRARLGAAA
ncbi:MAG: amidohydrolase family protein, partial [Steroidobacteraceae bacterium]